VILNVILVCAHHNYFIYSAEAFHRQFNKQFFTSNRHIYQVIEVIFKIHSETELKIASINKNKNNYRRKESIESVEHRMEKYISDEIDEIKYLEILGDCYYKKY